MTYLQKQLNKQLTLYRLSYYRNYMNILFSLMPNNVFKNFYNKAIKIKFPSDFEKILFVYFEKYKMVVIKKIDFVPPVRTKEKKEDVLKRVRKYRTTTKKVSLQITTSKLLKNQFRSLANRKGLSSGELLKVLLEKELKNI